MVLCHSMNAVSVVGKRFIGFFLTQRWWGHKTLGTSAHTGATWWNFHYLIFCWYLVGSFYGNLEDGPRSPPSNPSEGHIMPSRHLDNLTFY